MDISFEDKYREYFEFFEETLKRFCASLKVFPPVLKDSMCYSLLSGGKRIRPVLFFASLDAFGVDFKEERELALALECIHTYSLIHDDLPAMDNDDFRRGNPSNHVVYGEANAILAGDALLSEACSLMFSAAKKSGRHLEAAFYLSECAGARGMVAGQSADLLYSGKNAGKDDLEFIYSHKTGKLIAAPLVMAAILAGSDKNIAEEFGMELGRLFQLTDDLLDAKGDSQKMGKTLGKDAEEDKLTCVKLYGIKDSELLADKSASKCLEMIQKHYDNNFFFEGIVRLVRGRDI